MSRLHCDEVVIFDINSFVEGKAMDINQSQYNLGSSVNIKGTCDPCDIAGSDIVVITSGLPRKDGMTRDDLLLKNSEVITGVSKIIKEKCSPSTFVICVTNPMDVMSWLVSEVLDNRGNGFPGKVVGMGGGLDSARCASFISEKLNVSVSDVRAVVLGGHGDLMVPTERYISVGGIPITHFIESGQMSREEFNQIVERTKFGGGEIIKKFGGVSAHFATASAIFAIIEAYIGNTKSVICCSTYIENKYGVKKSHIGVPCVIGSNGVESILELPLDEEAQEQFKKSSDSICENAVKVGIKL